MTGILQKKACAAFKKLAIYQKKYPGADINTSFPGKRRTKIVKG